MLRSARILAALVAAVGALLLSAPAGAITRGQANAIALRTLKPQSLKGPTILFGLAKPLSARQVVVEAGSVSLKAIPFVPKGSRLGKAAWLFWLDQAAYARFLHPSRLLLVDDATGKVLRSAPMSFYPLIDGKRPSFLSSWTAYASPATHVYTNLPGGAGSRTPGRSGVPARARPVPPDAFRDDCLISIGLRDDPLFSGDFTGVVGWAQSVGLRAFRPPRGPGGRAPGGAELASGVDSLVESERCKDVFIFVSGHGYPGPRYVPAIQTGEPGPRDPWLGVTADDLRGILRAHPRTSFKLKINGCYSGRFVEPLQGEPNLLVLETAASTSEYSWGPLPQRFRHPDGRVIEVPARENPGRSEFVNGNLAGLTAFFASAEEVRRAQDQGGSLLGRALERAFALGAGADGARGAGLTHPVLHANFPNFAVKILAGYRHLGATSEVCGLFGTDPAQPGASYTATITGPGVAGTPTKSGTTASVGEGAFSFGIDAYGTYTVTVTVTAGGLTRTATATVVVTAAAGSCP